MSRIDLNYWLTCLVFIIGSIVYSLSLSIKIISFQTLFVFIIFGTSLSFTRYILIRYYLRDKDSYSSTKVNSLPNLNKPIFILLIFSVVYFILFITLNSNTTNLTEIPREIALRRYTQELKMPFYLKILRLTLTAGSILASIQLAQKLSFLAILSIFLVFFDGLMSSGKAGPLQGVLYCFFTYLGTSVFYLNKQFKISLFKILKIGVFFILFLFVTQLGRLKDFNIDTYVFVVNRLFNYAFGGVNAFDYWFNNSYSFFNYTLNFGTQTFGGLFELLGIQDRVQGIYQEGIRFGDQPPTNIFTGFRHLLLDYNLLGLIGFGSLISLIGLVTEYKIKSGNVGYLFIYPVLQTYLSWIFFSSMFSYNTYIISIILAYIIFKWNCKIRKYNY